MGMGSHFSRDAGPLAMLWPWPLTFDTNHDASILVPNYINSECLVKFSPLVSRYHVNKAKSPSSTRRCDAPVLGPCQLTIQIQIQACWTTSWSWTLIQNLKHSSLSQNAPMLKVWRKYDLYLSRYCAKNCTDKVLDAQTDRETDEQPEYIQPPATT